MVSWTLKGVGVGVGVVVIVAVVELILDDRVVTFIWYSTESSNWLNNIASGDVLLLALILKGNTPTPPIPAAVDNDNDNDDGERWGRC